VLCSTELCPRCCGLPHESALLASMHVGDCLLLRCDWRLAVCRSLLFVFFG
jgi:hypothetical protein